MQPSQFTEEQIIGMLKEQEAGAKTADVCRKHGISSATFYKFKAKFGGMEVSDARRLKGKRPVVGRLCDCDDENDDPKHPRDQTDPSCHRSLADQ